MSRFIPNKPDVDAADGDKDGFQIDLSKWDTETQDSVERGQRSVNKVALGAGLIALVFAGNVIAFRKSRNAPGKDAARAYHIIQKSRVFSGGRYPVLPPWLVRKYGADNVTEEMIEEDVIKNWRIRREMQERLDVEKWKSLRLQRLTKKIQDIRDLDLDDKVSRFREMKMDAMYREGLISVETLKQAKELFETDAALERRAWETSRATFFSSIFGPNLPNLTGQPVEHEFADTVMHKRSNIHVERDFEYILGKLEDVMRNQGSDYYKVLGVKPSAGIEEIKQAYRKELKKWHPDTYQGNDPIEASKNFRLVCDAYQMLADQERKKNYDERSKQAEERKQQGKMQEDDGYI